MSPLKASEAQLFYAKVLNRMSLFGFALLVLAFLIYISGLMSSYVPMSDVLQYWTQSSHHYLTAAKIEPGWAWVTKLNYGDFLVYVPIAVLAGTTVICYIGVVFKLLKGKETVLVAIAILEILVLLAAASGFLKAGGH